MSEHANAAVPDLVLGTAGHIDHGKSTLVQVLTGTDPDRLAEEKQRGITIELGFAQLVLPDGTAMGVVDVPGHEKFVRQMIAGSTGINVALLCIAADDGIMPQTEEHLAVLELLAIPTCVVALTKCDLVDNEWAAFMADEVRGRLAATPYANADVVPVSSRTGAGLDELRASIQKAAHATARHAASSTLRLPVDRSFTIKGAGTVITGTLWSGVAAVGDEVEIMPAGTRTRIRSVQVHGKPVDAAAAGHRTALNLNAVSTDQVRPGDFLCTPGSVVPTDHFDVDLTYLGTPGNDKPLESGSRVHVAHGTKECIGRVLLMDDLPSIAPGQKAAAQIRTEEDLPVSYGDRFVIRSYSPVHVIGGGVVLRAHPRRTTTINEGDKALLEALRSGDEAAAVQAAFAQAEYPVSAGEISQATGLSAARAAKELAALVEARNAQRISTGNASAELFTTKRQLQKLSKAIENALLKFHAANPAATGIAKDALRQSVMPKASTEAFAAVLASAQASGQAIMCDGLVSHPQAGAGARVLEEQNAQKLSDILREAGVKPPFAADLFTQADLAPKQAYKALVVLEKQGRIEKVNDDLFFDSQAFATLKTAVAEQLAGGPASATELKDAMGLSRKHAIPVLEHLDGTGFTRRVGDARELVK